MNDQLLAAITDEAKMRMIAAGTDARLGNPGRFSGPQVAVAEAAAAVAGALRVLHNEGYSLANVADVEGGVEFSDLQQLADEVEGQSK